MLADAPCYIVFVFSKNPPKKKNCKKKTATKRCRIFFRYFVGTKKNIQELQIILNNFLKNEFFHLFSAVNISKTIVTFFILTHQQKNCRTESHITVETKLNIIISQQAPFSLQSSPLTFIPTPPTPTHYVPPPPRYQLPLPLRYFYFHRRYS